MKYWTELSNLETQIIRLETIKSLFSLMASGAEQSSEEDIRNALWYVEGSLTDIHDNLRNEFNQLWETARNEHFDGMAKKVKNKK
jgi:5-methylthioribose kinase